MIKVVIFGAGTVGMSVARALAEEENDVTLVDRNASRLHGIGQKIDIRTVYGDACDPLVLDDADIGDVDLVLAVTDDDHTNMLVCQLASMIGNPPQLIARLRNQEFQNRSDELFGRDANQIPVDNIISPERLVTDAIIRLIRHPGAIQIVELAEGKIQLMGIKADEGGKLVGHKIRELRDHLPSVETRVAAVYRKDEPIIPKAGTVIQPGDEVFFIAAPKHIAQIMTELSSVRSSFGKRVMIAGGGNIGMRLSSELAPSEFRVKLLEINEKQADLAARSLPKTTIIIGSATDPALLVDEYIEAYEVFCAVTDNDEVNLISAMIAKKLGARRTMAVISNPEYAELLDETGIDILISPHLSTISEVLRYVRRGATQAVHSLRRGVAEALEIIVYGTRNTSKVVGRTIRELNLPHGTSCEAILRGDDVLMARSNLMIKSNDRVIVFVMHKDRKQVAFVHKLFEPSVLFV